MDEQVDLRKRTSLKVRLLGMQFVPEAQTAERPVGSPSWARLIQKVWEISPVTCSRCGGEMRVVSVITDPAVIDKILRHIEKKGRAPPEGEAAA